MGAFPFNTQDPLSKVFSDPVCTMGIIPLPLRLASKKAPSLKGLISLVFERVPSGNRRMEDPFFISSSAWLRNWAPDRRDSLLIRMELVSERTIPINGSLKFSVFEVHLKGLRSLYRARMSISDLWLDTRTTGRFHGIFLRPSRCNFQKGIRDW